ncbi:MAG: MarR family transcriptional regulator [Nitrosopumilus sp.]|uniref:helix-turn-helix transcriptional regulator n=1 Tax=Nitrosopumilus sp. TaxID=2024843 RepID=UPI00247C3A44|nr:MarR family transcriptional regulator [Nitrosopumilus sp.]MCV0393272.1 MarR family transcriptional regulator [Nitrosopumilus sp.]
MNPEIVTIHRKESLREDGMLFVRTEGILETMVRAPLLITGLIVVALTIPLQTSFSTTRMLDLTLYSDGSAHISAQIDVDPLQPDFEVNLFGSSIDNFVAVGENGFLLSSEINSDTATIDTFGSSLITIDYDIHDLISKEGRVWTFSLDSPTDYSLLMPPNTIIVGLNALPTNMIIKNDQTKLELGSGLSEINYIFGTTTPPTTTPPTTTPPTTTPDLPLLENNAFAMIGIPIAAAAAVIIMIKRKQSKSSSVLQSEIPESKTKIDPAEIETIFNLRPDMREDDKEIVKFISENGGQVLESELRKKFLQPRTTMWRAVKRLERQGVIEISKKDLQNLVKLKKEMEAEE